MAAAAVGEWLRLGGRRIDAAYLYGTQQGVGVAGDQVIRGVCHPMSLTRGVFTYGRKSYM